MQKNTRLFVFLLLGFFFFGGSVLSAHAQACVGQATGLAGTCMQNSACPSGQHDTDQVCGAFPNECCTNAPGSGTGAGGGNPGAPTTSQYVPLENIPGCEQGNNLCSGYLPDYLQALYRFTFWAVGIAALFMLSVGGFMYVTSAGNTSRLGTAKDIIRDSLIGLVLAIVAWLFLYIINPDLVKLNLPGVVPGSSTTPQPTPAPIPPTGAIPTGSVQDLVKQILSSPNITFDKNPECKMNASTPVSVQLNLQEAGAANSNGQMTRCFKGCNKPGADFCSGTTTINPSLLQAILQVAKTRSIVIISISGGSHSSNSAHYTGNAIDIGKTSGTWAELQQAFRDAGVSANCDNNVFVACSDPSVTHVHIGSGQ